MEGVGKVHEGKIGDRIQSLIIKMIWGGCWFLSMNTGQGNRSGQWEEFPRRVSAHPTESSGHGMTSQNCPEPG